MISARKKRNHRRAAVVVVYLLAIIGGYTVALNVYTAGASAVSHVQGWFSGLRFSTPVLVQAERK